MADINDLIAGGIKPPAQEDYTAASARALSLANAMQNQQRGRQALQEGEIALAKQRRAEAGDRAVRDAMSANTTIGDDGTPVLDHAKALAQLYTGGHAPEAMQLQTSLAAQQKAQNEAKLEQFKVTGARAGRLGEIAQSIQNAKPEDRADAYRRGMFAIKAEGLASPADMASLPAAYTPDLDSHIEEWRAQSMATKDFHDAKVKDLTTAATVKKDEADTAKTAEATAEAWRISAANQASNAQSQQQLDGIRDQLRQKGAPPAALAAIPLQWSPEAMQNLARGAMSSEKRADVDQAAATLAETKQRDANTATYQQGELRNSSARVGMEGQRLGLAQKEYQQKFGDVLGQMSPANQAIAQKLAVGEFDPAQLGRLPGKEQIIAGAIAMNPAWTPQVYATKKSFTDPEKTQAKNLATISRIVGHIGRFESNSQEIGFAPAYAAGMNVTGQQNKLNEDAHAVSGELEKLVSGGVGSVEQTREWQKSLHSPSADARQKAIDEISQLIGSQYEGMNQTYKSAVQTDLPIEKYVTPAGRAWMKSKGINVSGAAAPASVPHVTTKAQFDALPSGSVYTEDDGKQYRKP